MTCEIDQRDPVQIRTVQSTIAGIMYRTVNYAVGFTHGTSPKKSGRPRRHSLRHLAEVGTS
jgi:hypothetical protein